MSVSPLFAVFGFLSGRTRTMGTSDIFLLLGLGSDLVLLFPGTAATTEGDTILQDTLEIVFFTHVKSLV